MELSGGEFYYFVNLMATGRCRCSKAPDLARRRALVDDAKSFTPWAASRPVRGERDGVWIAEKQLAMPVSATHRRPRQH